jgi:hypothetical protein
MLFAVPPAFSLAAFFVLQVASLITASFHFGRSQAHNPQFHSAYIRFSPLQSSGSFLFLAHLRSQAGCGLSRVAAKLLLQKFTFSEASTLASPCVVPT